MIFLLTYHSAPGDRSHIPANAQPVFEILSADMERVKGRAPAAFKQQVDDAERRLNILFDHLNNEDLLKPNTVEDMANLARAIQARDYATATSIHVAIMTNQNDECGNWMVSHFRCSVLHKCTNLFAGWCQASYQHEPCYPINDTFLLKLRNGGSGDLQIPASSLLFHILQRCPNFVLVHVILNVLRIFFLFCSILGIPWARSVDEQSKNVQCSYIWCVLHEVPK